MSYIEWHARSAFSFLRGGSGPEEMAKVAGALQLPAFALCDRDGVYGAVRAHTTAKEEKLTARVGCELTLDDGSVVPVLAATQAGYRQLGALLTRANLRAPKGEGRVTWAELEEGNAGLIALTGDEEGPVRRAWRERGPAAAAAAGEKLRRIFGPDRLWVELQRHLVAGEESEIEFLVAWARATRLPLLATNGVTYAVPKARDVTDVFTCLREHVTLDTAGRRLAVNRERHFKSGAEMSELFADLPEAIANTQRLAEQCDFTLDHLGYRFPNFAVPPGETQDSYLRLKTYEGARERFPAMTRAVENQLDKELALIARFGFSGYFLIVWDLCKFARECRSLIQGRGSAANSAVCFALGITVVNPIENKLLFERFLSEGRHGADWPDIDLDLPSEERREQVIQEVYRRYTRQGAAMVANVICYRGRSTMREVGKVLGLPDDVLDRYSSLFHHGDYGQTLKTREHLRLAGISDQHPRLAALLDTCAQVQELPRHLGQHSGGMVICAGALSDFVPLENARMPGRSVLQWDKTDCEEMGLIKIDFLGLGMMAVLQESVEICAERGETLDFSRIPNDDPATYEMLQRADTIGMFQVESRAQMSTLPRLKPKVFYDIVVEVAIIRPGPIHGDAVNPYLARRAGQAEITYPDPRIRHVLERTLGVVLFQEQILSIAMELGGFTAGEADELRRAIGFTRSQERLERMVQRLREGMARNNVAPEAAESIVKSLRSFALYGFPESHAISFAKLAYSSAWLKVHRRAAFYAALLNNQPMGFYSSATLVQDARRHDLRTLPVCIVESGAKCRVIADDTIRLGFNSVRGLRAAVVEKMLAARRQRPFASLTDFLHRTDFNPAERRALAKAGALNALARHRRAALWEVETAAAGDDLFRLAPPAATEAAPGSSPLEPMTHLERLQSDYQTLGLTTGRHPMALLRDRLPEVIPAAGLRQARPGTIVRIAGAVITRQRPGTANGVCFITLEDETGHSNAIVRPAIFERLRMVINLEPMLLITGRLQNEQGVVHILAEKIEPLLAALDAGSGTPTGFELPAQESHDYH